MRELFRRASRSNLLVKTREGCKIAECVSRAFLLACISNTFRKRCKLYPKVLTGQVGLRSSLAVEDDQKVTRLSNVTPKRTHADTKLNQILKLRKLISGQDKHCELWPQGMDKWVVNLTDQCLSKPQQEVYAWVELHTSFYQTSLGGHYGYS